MNTILIYLYNNRIRNKYKTIPLYDTFDGENHMVPKYTLLLNANINPINSTKQHMFERKRVEKVRTRRLSWI